MASGQHKPLPESPQASSAEPSSASPRLSGAWFRWDLVLNKPYSDGGYENSSRVQKNGWDNVGVKAAAKVHGCTLNDPSSGPCKGWTAEVAFPLAGLSFNNTNTVPPKPGSYWRCALSSPPPLRFSCEAGCSAC